MSSKHSRLPRGVKTSLALGLLFIVLGAGNILFGLLKLQSYEKALSEVSHGLTSPQPQAAPPWLHTNRDSEEQYILRLRARIDFYEFVLLGGKSLLALGGIFLLTTLLYGQREANPSKTS